MSSHQRDIVVNGIGDLLIIMTWTTSAFLKRKLFIKYKIIDQREIVKGIIIRSNEETFHWFIIDVLLFKFFHIYIPG